MRSNLPLGAPGRWGRPSLSQISRGALLAFLLTLPASALNAQGCSQCLDSTRATPPEVQAAYRHAIYLLGGFGCTLFIMGTALIRKAR